MTATTHTTPVRQPLPPFVEWLRVNLFPNWWQGLISLIVIFLVVEILLTLLGWGLFDAVWSTGNVDACKAEGAGACWPVIYEKFRFIMFGRYPFADQWRPMIATIIFLSLIVFSCMKIAWKPWLAAVWAVGLIACGGLMYRGFFGIEYDIAVLWGGQTDGGVLGAEYVGTELWGGLPLTLMLAVVSCVLAFPLSILLALGRRSDMPAIKAVCVGFIELIRGVPLITVLFMASVMLPLFLPTGVTIDKVLRALVGFTLFVSAYLAEVVRGGLQGLPKGQYEAADALGLSYWQKMITIVLPQALRSVIPPLVNTFIGAFKDTSLVVIISLTDLLLAAKTAVGDPAWRPYFIEVYVFVALIYFIFCFSMSKYSQWLEKDLSRGQRREKGATTVNTAKITQELAAKGEGEMMP